MNEYYTSIVSDLLQSVNDNQDHCSLTITPTVLDGIKHFRFKEIKVEDVLKSLKPLKTCKATGADGKPAQILKIELGSESTPGHFSTSPLMNLCSELVRFFPEALKVARVTPIYKGGVLTIGRTNKFIPPPWYKGDGTPPRSLCCSLCWLCCSILKRFYL